MLDSQLFLFGADMALGDEKRKKLSKVLSARGKATSGGAGISTQPAPGTSLATSPISPAQSVPTPAPAQTTQNPLLLIPFQPLPLHFQSRPSHWPWSGLHLHQPPWTKEKGWWLFPRMTRRILLMDLSSRGGGPPQWLHPTPLPTKTLSP